MEKTLKTVEKNIQHCEDIAKSDPMYYEEHWTDIHESLLTMKEKLEEEDEN